MLMKKGVSSITRRNWWIDAALFASGLTAGLSGVYFLFFPIGGFQGGRNSYYNIQILFNRHTWGDLHMWAGVVMISIAAVHILLHWSWVVSMTRRIFKDIIGKNGKMNWRGRLNLVLNIVVGISFVLTAISGVYFLFTPGGRNAVEPMFLFSRVVWDLIHTWAGVVLAAAAVFHFTIHWRWIVNVWHSIMPQGRAKQNQPVLPENA